MGVEMGIISAQKKRLVGIGYDEKAHENKKKR